jgi:hypothetical protein
MSSGPDYSAKAILDPLEYRGQKLPLDVHIGLAKTGTTAIQHYLQANRKTLLSEYGLLYPSSLGNRLAVNLAAACQRSSEPDDLRKIRHLDTPSQVASYFDALQRQFAAELESTNPTRILISCEHLSSRLSDSDEIRQLATFLRPFAGSIRIFVYLRRQDELFLSLYSTSIKAGSTEPFGFPVDTGSRQDFHFEQLLHAWAEVFGEDSICPRLYERSRFASGDVVADFCAALKLPGDLTRADSDQNQSLSPEMLDRLRALNEQVPRFVDGRLNPEREERVAALSALESREFRLVGGQEGEAFYRRFEDSNRAVAARWFTGDASVSSLLFSDSSG